MTLAKQSLTHIGNSCHFNVATLLLSDLTFDTKCKSIKMLRNFVNKKTTDKESCIQSILRLYDYTGFEISEMYNIKDTLNVLLTSISDYNCNFGPMDLMDYDALNVGAEFELLDYAVLKNWMDYNYKKQDFKTDHKFSHGADVYIPFSYVVCKHNHYVYVKKSGETTYHVYDDVRGDIIINKVNFDANYSDFVELILYMNTGLDL